LCLSAEELILIHGLGANGSWDLGRPGLARLSPALVQQILSGACTKTADSHAPDELSEAESERTEASPWKPAGGIYSSHVLLLSPEYLYATLANAVITLAALIGIVMLLCTSCTSAFQLVIQFCVSLAVGSLTGDALLHLLPMVLGLHLHSDDTSGINHAHDDHEEGPPDHLYKLLVVMGGIYAFYLMETIFSLLTSGHQHHHGVRKDAEKTKKSAVPKRHQERCRPTASQRLCLVLFSPPGQRVLPYMVTIGDGIHNFADGLAVGAAFSLSWRSGLATSVAVLCHELPHELGDFAILLHSGLSVCRALLLNLGSAMCSFVGLYIALAVATDLATKQWIAAITTGLFLYVGLADMVGVRPDKPTAALLKEAPNFPLLLALASHPGPHQPREALADVPPAERWPADGLGHSVAALAFRRENQLLDTPARRAGLFSSVLMYD
ncbi:unnamed protein product, partial [Tetraodon nigroviridis]